MNVTTVREESAAARILLRAGLFPPVMKLPRVVSAMRRSGPAGIADVFALRSPSKSAIVDDDGEITYAEFARLVRLWTGAIAGQLPADRQGTVGLVCRNSRYLM